MTALLAKVLTQNSVTVQGVPSPSGAPMDNGSSHSGGAVFLSWHSGKEKQCSGLAISLRSKAFTCICLYRALALVLSAATINTPLVSVPGLNLEPGFTLTQFELLP